jgi:metallo-beta-lactamase class B
MAVACFKPMAAEPGMPYQNLINLFSRDCAMQKRRPFIQWPEDQPKHPVRRQPGHGLLIYSNGQPAAGTNSMKPTFWIVALTACVWCGMLHAQKAPYPPFTAKQAELGKQLAATSADVRKQITNATGPAEPFKIAGNLYFVGNANGEVYLLTSPQGHIMMGTGSADSVQAVQKNIESLGFKMTDIKAILVNHNHGDQSGGAAYMREKTGAPLMAGFGEIPFVEHGMFNPPAVPPPPPPAGAPGRGGPPRYPAAKVDRALFDGDVVKVGPLSVTTYLIPGHSPSPVTFAYTVKDGGRSLKVIEFCCWEYPDDLTANAYITEASVAHTFETFRKLYPVDIYLELGMYAWGGVLNQPSGTLAERLAKAKADPRLFVNREIFNQFSAAREVEFEEKMAKIKTAGR